jgi:hypothetical protein
VRDDMTFFANPYFSGLQLAPAVPLSPLSIPGDQSRAVQTRSLGPMPEDDGFRPLAPADARMFLGRNYDPAKTYRRNRLTGEIESTGGLPAADGIGQTTETSELSQPPLSDRERLLKLGRGEQNYSPWNRDEQTSPGAPPSSSVGRIDSPVAAPPPGSVGRRVLDGVGDAAKAVGDAASTFSDWRETRGNRVFGNMAGLPRAIVESSGIGEMVPSLMPYVHKYLPTPDEATNFIRRNGGIFPVRGQKLFQPGASVPPETNLPGRWGKAIDGIVEGVVGAALTGTPPSRLLMMGGFTGVGSALARERARQREQRENSQQSPYGFGDLFNR